MIFLAAIAALATTSVLQSPPKPSGTAPRASLAGFGGRTLSSDERSLVALVNASRERSGRAPLRIDPTLSAVAFEHSADMAQRGYFDHEAPAPESSTPLSRYIKGLGYQPQRVTIAENIYYASGLGDGPSIAVKANNGFMASSGHRSNMLGQSFEAVGVGIYRSSNGGWWVTEVFATTNDGS